MKLLMVALFTLVFFSGCTPPKIADEGSGYTPIAETVTSIPGVTVVEKKYFAYVANYYTDTVTVFSLNTLTGDLVQVEEQDTGVNPLKTAASPDGKFLFVTNSGDDTVSSFAVNSSTGALTLIETEAAGDYPHGIAVSSDGAFLYVANEISGTVKIYSINTVSGVMDWVGDQAVESAPHKIEISGRYIYVTNWGDASVSVFARHSVTGLLFPVDVQDAGTNPVVIKVDSRARFAYASNFGSNTISVFSVAKNGALTAIETVETDLKPFDIVIKNGYLFVAHWGAGTIGCYRINETTGRLTLDSNAETGANPTSLVTHKDGAYLLVTSEAEASVRVFSIGEAGILTQISADFPVGGAPESVSVITITQ